MEEAARDPCGCSRDRCDLCSDKRDCKPDRTGTDPSSGDHTAGQNAEKAMVIKKAGGIRFFCNGKKLMSPAFWLYVLYVRFKYMKRICLYNVKRPIGELSSV